jgi:hypothetical protein
MYIYSFPFFRFKSYKTVEGIATNYTFFFCFEFSMYEKRKRQNVQPNHQRYNIKKESLEKLYKCRLNLQDAFGHNC